MKANQKNKFIQILLKIALLSALVLSGIVSLFLGRHPACSTDTHILFTISLTNNIVLLLVITLAYLLIKKIQSQISSEKQQLDPLTGFMTRHSFCEVFEQSMIDAKRSLEPLSAIIVDIDHFRLVNEQHGNHIGDELLAMLSQSIQSVLRTSDITCRWEGDQILVILKDCSNKDCVRIAGKLLDTIRKERLELGKTKIKITVSIGLAQMLSNDSLETLVARAETGMHSARDNGRNTYATGYDWILIDYSCDPIF